MIVGIALRLLPCEHWNVTDGRVWGFSHTILNLGDVDVDAWNVFLVQVKPHLKELPEGHDLSSYVGALVPDGFYKGEKAYGTIRPTDSYGEAYQYVSAQHLLPWLAEHFQYDGHRGYGPYQAAIVAYVRALPPHTKIILDWH